MTRFICCLILGASCQMVALTDEPVKPPMHKIEIVRVDADKLIIESLTPIHTKWVKKTITLDGNKPVTYYQARPDEPDGWNTQKLSGIRVFQLDGTQVAPEKVSVLLKKSTAVLYTRTVATE